MVREPFATRLTAIWIGGMFFWILNGFRGSFSDQISEKNEKRNLLVGYILELIFLIVLIYLLFFKD
jgi:hypothetical protein